MAKKKDTQEPVNKEEEIIKEKAADSEKKTAKKEKKDDKELLKLKDENEKLKNEAGKLKETAQRIQAEFDNYRRRSLSDGEQQKAKAASSVVNAILPALDSMDEAIKVYSEDEEKKELLEGFEKIQKQLLDSLASIGVSAMDCEGKEFDPNLHEAVMMQECNDKDSGIIITVFRKGYMYKESVVRHAQVIVSK